MGCFQIRRHQMPSVRRLSLDGEFTTLAKPSTARVRNDPFTEGVQLYQGGQYDMARKVFDKLVRTNPHLSKAWLNLGNCFFQLKDYDAAYRAWKTAIDQDPMEEKAYLNLGNLHYKRGCFNSAIFYWEIFKTLRPNHLSVYLNLGIAYERTHNLHQAVQNYNYYVNESPANRDSVKINMRFEKAHLHYKQLVRYGQKQLALGLIPRAMEYYKKAFEVYPGLVDDLKVYAALVYKKGNLDLAQDVYEQAIKLSPEDPIILTNLAVIYEKQGLWIEAIWAYTRARNHPGPEQAILNKRHGELVERHGLMVKNYIDDTLAIFRRGDYDQVELRLRYAQDLAPLLPNGVSKVTDLIQQMKDIHEPGSRATKVFWKQAQMAEGEGKFDQAMYYYQRIVDVAPNHPYATKAREKLGDLQQGVNQVIASVLGMGRAS